MDTQTTLDLEGDRAFTTRQAARRLGVSVSLLNKLCAHGEGPAHHRYGKRAVFHAVDLAAFAAAHRVEAGTPSDLEGRP